MARRARGRGWESRDAQCSQRRYGLTHVQDGSAECVFCGVQTYGPTATAGRVEYDEATIAPEEVEARLDGAPSPFTPKQARDLEFLRWLFENGRV